MHVKKGDKVIVITGKEKGKTGVVSSAIPSQNKVIIEGLNLMKKHNRPRKSGEKGTIVDIPQPIHVSNVKLADKKEKKANVGKEVKKVKKTK